MSKLYIIPTPIGNLEDITLRALRILKEVDYIIAEDTRVTHNLLKHFEITKKIYSYHKFNEHKVTENIINNLKAGAVIGMVSDAGTPAISDPGFFIVRECIINNIDVECLTGPTAFVPALVLSGLPNESFVFEGFLPVKKGRQTKLTELATERRTIVLYESPHRIVKTLEQIKEYFGPERLVSVSREISKMYEETVRGSIQFVAENFKNRTSIKGEFVITINGSK
ncbi:MAG: 16S rRNA (cytidine(1402)-2'-O)-methyltransferase [Bacteroidetes bacterium GWE2_29_8]|nr:MAG: 16S rRNA (cytidine(1402)-2'-O)-methyltransferase [Bacteroidetes bacterium GWE2_29_8]OFY16593.1 MAG: 16S rRNA (cytidine(1402)-2'-O)-methyltransferase [Bacteroidetes bacterium GWF2_29_10]